MDGVRYAVESGMFVREAGDGPVLVFVHGLGESGLCFEHLLAHPGLTGHRLLVPDLPGYGRSAPAAAPLGLADQADLLAEWLSGRGLERPWVVGHSMGGVVGVLLAERHGGRLAGLVDVDGNVSLADCVFSGRAMESTRDEFLAGGFDRLRDTVYRQGARERAHRGYYASMRLADPLQYHLNSAELLEASRPEDMARRLAGLVCPAHYVAGVPRGASERSRELLDAAGVEWTAIEESGHWPFVDQPDRFVEVLLRVTGSGPAQK